MQISSSTARAVWVLLASCACACTDVKAPPPSVTPDTHAWFPITAGAAHAIGAATVNGPIGCDSCHRPSAPSFAQVRCEGCHAHPEALSDRLHLGVADYPVDTRGVADPEARAELRGAACYRCHPTGEPQPFSHAKITGQCAQCHAPTEPFAALPKAGFTHPAYGAADCGGCHVTSSWKGGTRAPNNAFDPGRSASVRADVPTFAGTTITRLTAKTQSLPMVMNHQATAVPNAVLADCATCHQDAAAGSYFPGVLHAALANAGVAQPVKCAECHTASQPDGFVGPLATAPARTPPSGEMRHEAVAWVNGARGTAPLVTADCVTCHTPETDVGTGSFTLGAGGGKVTFHAALTTARQPQPTSCLDCHANSRPVALLTAANAALPTGRVMDHTAPEALGDCSSCHASASTWTGGVFHRAGAPRPSTCESCHGQERPTSTAGWKSTSYTRSPFDYVSNPAATPPTSHGGGEDCAVCHAATDRWEGGVFAHGPGTLAATTCAACHTTQRPAAVVQGFNHALNGTGDCRGCHQATVAAGRYVDLVNPATGTFPGDWAGGAAYPADVLSVSQSQSITLSGLTLQRLASGWVTGMTPQSSKYFNGMLHTSAAIPAQLTPGTAAAPNNNACWHCHTHTNGTVTAFADGKFHAALKAYAATPGGAVTPLPEVSSGCNDCHEQMRPNTIVLKAGAALQPMDHSATFAAPVTIGGVTVGGVGQMACATCHGTPGQTWSDGKLHSAIGGATPADCVRCHYPLLASAAADKVQGTTYAMKHRSGQVTLQACEACHPSALSKATTTPVSAAAFNPGQLHAKLSAQPSTCLDCHAASEPAAATQGSVVYALAVGGTATNGGQWMSHAGAQVAALDCASCHAADAKATGSAWSKATRFHAVVAQPDGCASCHGTANGRGTTPGASNNLPAGLTPSRTTTTASTGPGLKDQISHADVNVTSRDCGFCHTQLGPSTAAGVQGQEWKQARFHPGFTGANALVLNGTTGRCSNCHLNLKPGPSYAKQDHSAFTATSAQDCASCHAYPGTNPAAPNWLGATGAHASSGPTAASALDCNSCHGQGGSSTHRLSVPAASHYGGVSNGNRCISCHVDFSGFAGTVTQLKYAHTNATANATAAGCGACHAFSAQLYTTLTTTPPLTFPTAAGGHAFSQATVVRGTFDGKTFNQPHTNADLTRCGSCHAYAATTPTTNVWTFRHRPSNPGISSSKNSPGCTQCH